jgi:hypothetical protein
VLAHGIGRDVAVEIGHGVNDLHLLACAPRGLSRGLVTGLMTPNTEGGFH